MGLPPQRQRVDGRVMILCHMLDTHCIIPCLIPGSRITTLHYDTILDTSQ
jgi:hypothetical protein